MNKLDNAVTCARRLRLYTHSIPVDVIRLTCALDINLRFKNLEDLPGYYLSTPAGAYMVINHNDPHVRRRFTIAHEICHHLLPETQGNDLYTIKYFSNKERVCNKFAAALLMPEDEVRRRLPVYIRQTKEETILEFSRQFDVSAQAGGFRLKELGLLEYITPDKVNHVQSIYRALDGLPESTKLEAAAQIADFVAGN